uniref:Uncharacterized protein MANES_07G105200 n=1 Tax=Rhizophora mucronata TaxID=61149 RepID=A0A2P2JPW8_RHIMU
MVEWVGESDEDNEVGKAGSRECAPNELVKHEGAASLHAVLY